MNAKVHQATTSAPEVEKVIVATRRTPFTPRISKLHIREFRDFKLSGYNGKGDPKEHLTSFQVNAGRVPLEPHEEDAGLCKLFSENLSGPALTWFTQLEEGSIDNFKQLSTAFSKQYGYFIKSDIIEAQVWNLPQSADDPLRSYITTFKEIMVQIPGLSDSAAQFALKNGLWHESCFRESLTVNRPETIQDALHRATNGINAEEEGVDVTTIELAQPANEGLESEEASPPNKKQKSEPAPIAPKGRRFPKQTNSFPQNV